MKRLSRGFIPFHLNLNEVYRGIFIYLQLVVGGGMVRTIASCSGIRTDAMCAAT